MDIDSLIGYSIMQKQVKEPKAIRRWYKWARRLNVQEYHPSKHDVSKALKFWKPKYRKKVWKAFNEMEACFKPYSPNMA